MEIIKIKLFIIIIAGLIKSVFRIVTKDTGSFTVFRFRSHEQSSEKSDVRLDRIHIDCKQHAESRYVVEWID